MKASIVLKVPEDVEVVLTIRATAGELKRVREQFEASPAEHNRPLSEFANRVKEGIRLAKQELFTQEGSEQMT